MSDFGPLHLPPFAFHSPSYYFDQKFADLKFFNKCHNYIGQPKKYFLKKKRKINGKSHEFLFARYIEK
jgi:hypothetical protein